MGQWVDFKELRERLDFAAVLRHYGVELKAKGQQHQGLCPLPNHPKHTGKKRTSSFSANLTKGIWQCFGCGGKGNVIEFAALMEGFDPKNKEDFRKAALALQDRFGIATTPPEDAKVSDAEKTAIKKAKGGGEEPKRVVVNAPLDFKLRELDEEHPYLRERGFSPDTVERFGLGYCSRGLMKGRIAIPLYSDPDDRLIGYAGRLVDQDAIGEDSPKYLFPSPRERKGTTYEFRKSLFLYSGSAIEKPVADLFVVEGFPAVWWLWQHGYRNVVGLMGSSCSSEQAAIIVDLVADTGRVWAFPDGDEAGERCAASVLTQVAPYRFVRWIKVEAEKQPTDFDAAELALILPAQEKT